MPLEFLPRGRRIGFGTWLSVFGCPYGVVGGWQGRGRGE